MQHAGRSDELMTAACRRLDRGELLVAAGYAALDSKPLALKRQLWVNCCRTIRATICPMPWVPAL